MIDAGLVNTLSVRLFINRHAATTHLVQRLAENARRRRLCHDGNGTSHGGGSRLCSMVLGGGRPISFAPCRRADYPRRREVTCRSPCSAPGSLSMQHALLSMA